MIMLVRGNANRFKAFNSLHMTNLNRIEVFPGKGMNEVEENSTFETAVFHMFTSCVGIWSMA